MQDVTDGHYDGELWQSRAFCGNASLVVEVIYNKSLIMYFFFSKVYHSVYFDNVEARPKALKPCSRSQQVKEYIHRCCGRCTFLKPQFTFNMRRTSRYIKDHCVFNTLMFNIVFLHALKTGVNISMFHRAFFN